MSLSPLRSITHCSIGLLLAVASTQIANSWSVALAQQLRSVTQQKTCPLTRSVYRAIGKSDFELIFGVSKSGIATEVAAFTLKHKTRGNIVSYNLGGSMGYGSLYLAAVGRNAENDAAEKLKPYFFDNRWKHINGMTNPAPRYFFVAGLGLEDWYSERKGNRIQPLGDVMWQFERCQPK